MRRRTVWAVLGMALGFAPAAGAPVWQPCARLVPLELRECSGVVASRQFEDVLWVHNDSGDMPRLFAVDHAGRLVREVVVEGARNVDWEDLTTDDAGNLYIGDFGNNRNERRDLVVYVVREPDPRASGGAILEVQVLRRLPFYFPEQRAFPDPDALNFDCEAMFWDAGRLYVLTKHRSDTRTVLYRLPAPGDSAAVRLGEAEIGSQVTAAALAPDGNHLVLLSYQYIHIFTRPAGKENFLDGPFHRVLIEGRQCEGICFVGDEIRFTNEQREIYCVRFTDLLASSAFMPLTPALRLARAMPAKRQGWAKPPTALTLHPEGPAGGTEGGRVPEVRLGWCDEGLVLRARWHVEADLAPAGETLLYFMCGPSGATEPRLQPGQQVWEARWTPTGVELRPLLPAPGPPLGSCVARRTKGHLVLEAVVPVRATAGATLALNVIARAPGDTSAREWAWAGGSSTQPLENPLLWGRAELVP